MKISMQKLKYLLNILLCGSSFMCGMDRSLMAFINPRKNYLCSYFKKTAASKRFYLDELPLDVQSKIVTNIFTIMLTNTITMSEDDKERYNKTVLESYVLKNVPIELGLKFSYEFI